MKHNILIAFLLLLTFNLFSQNRKIIKGYKHQINGIILSMGIDSIKNIKNTPFNELKIEFSLSDRNINDILIFKITSTSKKEDDFIYVIFDISNHCLIHVGGYGNSSLENREIDIVMLLYKYLYTCE